MNTLKEIAQQLHKLVLPSMKSKHIKTALVHFNNDVGSSNAAASKATRRQHFHRSCACAGQGRGS